MDLTTIPLTTTDTTISSSYPVTYVAWGCNNILWLLIYLVKSDTFDQIKRIFYLIKRIMYIPQILIIFNYSSDLRQYFSIARKY